MNRTTLLTVAGVTAVAGVAAYAIYFDQKRRADSAFRKNLKKDRRRVNKAVEHQAEAAEDPSKPNHDFDAALEKIRRESILTNPSEFEQFFMERIQLGEQLSAQGPLFHFPAAVHFFAALRVYPSPAEMLGIYRQTLPPPIFALVTELMNRDVSSQKSGRGGESNDGIDDEDTDTGVSATRSTSASRSASRTGPPSETSSHDWEKLTDHGRSPL